MLKPVHPFPARMAPSIVEQETGVKGRSLKILDPMCGSGSTLALARYRGHKAIGFDVDPLAVLISKCWTSNVNADLTEKSLDRIIRLFKRKTSKCPNRDILFKSYDEETQAFIRYWFDDESALQLALLARWIKQETDSSIRNIFWTALSRMIVVKTKGVSRAMDVSHSRPHRKYEKAPILPFELFPRAVRLILSNCPFRSNYRDSPVAQVSIGDARKLILTSGSMDIAITSPPYLNAIDYMRAHRMSLIWMGHRLSELRTIRRDAIGTENGYMSKGSAFNDAIEGILLNTELSKRTAALYRKYVSDIYSVLSELYRVLKVDGKLVLVIGDSFVEGNIIRNSIMIDSLAKCFSLRLVDKEERPIEERRRYLPPPHHAGAGKSLQNRIKTEVIISYVKTA